jgi:hypothetical protein
MSPLLAEAAVFRGVHGLAVPTRAQTNSEFAPRYGQPPPRCGQPLLQELSPRAVSPVNGRADDLQHEIEVGASSVRHLGAPLKDTHFGPRDVISA